MSGGKVFVATVFLVALIVPASAFDHQHQLWKNKLQKYVYWLDTGVDRR